MARPGHFGDSAGSWNEVCRQLWAELGMRVPYDALAEIRRIRKKRGGKQGNTEQKMECKILLAIRDGIPWEHAFGKSISYIIARRDGGRDELSNIRLAEPSAVDYLEDYNQKLEFKPPAEWPEKNEEKMIVEAPEGKFTIPPVGEHIAKLISYKDKGEQEDKFNPGKTVHKMELIWELKNGSRQFQWPKHSLHPLSNFYKIAEALLQEKPPQKVDPPDLIGKSAILTIEHYEGNKGRRSKVVDIRAIRYKGRRLPEPVEEIEEEQPGEVEEQTEDVPF